jgi:hypothetical protein
MKSRFLLPVVLLGVLPPFPLFAAQQRKSKDDKPFATTANSLRFDDLVRADFFAGMMGDRNRFERAMQLCETTLAKNPKDVEAMVWHGSGLLVRSEQFMQKEDFKQSGILFQNGLDEMDQAVAMAPDNPHVLLPQGATLLSVSAAPLPHELSKRLLQKAVQDFEKVLKLQAPYFATLPLHARGELLSGLADGWHRLGDENKSREYNQRIVTECAGSSYASNSEMWLNNEPLANRHPACQGCHTK